MKITINITQGRTEVELDIGDGSPKVKVQSPWDTAPPPPWDTAPPSPPLNEYRSRVAAADPFMRDVPAPPQPTISPDVLQAGAQAFYALVEEWLPGWGHDVAQPDRRAILRRYVTNDGPAMLAFVQSVGGLSRATQGVTPRLDGEVETEFIGRAGRLAANIAQVASVEYPPLATELRFDRATWAASTIPREQAEAALLNPQPMENQDE